MGLFNNYLESFFDNYNGKKTPASSLLIDSPEFPYLELQLHITKHKTLQIQYSFVNFEMEIIELIKIMINDLYLLQKDLFDILVNEI